MLDSAEPDNRRENIRSLILQINQTLNELGFKDLIATVGDERIENFISEIRRLIIAWEALTPWMISLEELYPPYSVLLSQLEKYKASLASD